MQSWALSRCRLTAAQVHKFTTFHTGGSHAEEQVGSKSNSSLPHCCCGTWAVGGREEGKTRIGSV